MIQKNKSKSNSLAELNFVSSLQIKQAIKLIGDIANDYHQVTLTEVSPDEFMFYIDYLPEKSKVAEIKGTVQRWNGTETKIDADGEELYLKEVDQNQDITWPLMISIFLIGLGSNLALAIGQDWLIILIVIGVIVTGLYINYKSEDKKAQKVIFRHRDYLLQRLIDAFKSAGDVEAI